MRFLNKLSNQYKKEISNIFTRREEIWHSQKPYISFTFDDVPHTAFTIGGEILIKYGLRATYFIAFGLMGKRNRLWEFFNFEDLITAILIGHEIGSHTYDHLDAWNAESEEFELSVKKNQNVMDQMKEGYRFRSFSYCFQQPHPKIKKIAQKYFDCCRGGGDDININTVDLNLLKSCFIGKHYRPNPDYYYKLIDKNAIRNGWLIFSTHDISENPSPYGCDKATFEKIVKYARESGSEILPLIEVYDKIFTKK